MQFIQWFRIGAMRIFGKELRVVTISSSYARKGAIWFGVFLVAAMAFSIAPQLSDCPFQ
jgi:hypothetical protein